MDIKRKRIRQDRNIDDSYPGLETGLGSAACDANINWYARSSSWQGNTNVDYKAIEAEAQEQNARWGTPDSDVLPNPGSQSNNTDAALPNPHNWSSNPGYMGTSTASMMTASAPGTGGTYRGPGAGSGSPRRPSAPVATVGRRPFAGSGNVALPAPGDTDPRSEGGPQTMTQGSTT